MTNSIIRIATKAEDEIIARHFYNLWLDNGVEADFISDDWLEKTLTFIDRSRRKLAFQSFIAETDDRIIASASCQLFAGLYPSPFIPEYRQYGYIWNVYVDAGYRRQGIASQLTRRAIDYLKEIGCTRTILHASPSGKPVYEKLGFVFSNEMRLDLD